MTSGVPRRPRHGGKAEYGAPLVLMHNQKGTSYRDLIGDIVEYFRESIRLAEQAGGPGKTLIIDPGFSFGKTPQQNLELLRRLKTCAAWPAGFNRFLRSLPVGKSPDLPVTSA